MRRLRLEVCGVLGLTLAVLVGVCGAQVTHQLPQATPGASYAAQLTIPAGLGYPFAHCELSGQSPHWLTVDCVRLQLKGKVPASGTGDADYQVTLRIEDSSGNSLSFPLALRVSASPQVVNLTQSPQGATVTAQVPAPTPASVPQETPVAELQPHVKTSRSTAPRPALVNANLTSASKPTSGSDEGNAAANLASSSAALKSSAPPVKNGGKAQPAKAGAAPAKQSDPAAGAKATALPPAIEGVFYSATLEINPPTDVSLSTKPTYALKEGSSWPSGLKLAQDGDKWVLSGIPDHTVKPALGFTIVVSDSGVEKLNATYSLEVDAAPETKADPASDGAAHPLKLEQNPIVVGQGYAQRLDVVSAKGCKSYAATVQPNDLNNLGLTFDSGTAVLATGARSAVTNTDKSPLPASLALEVTCTPVSGGDPVKASFSIPVQAEREAASVTGAVPTDCSSSDAPNACTALEAVRNLKPFTCSSAEQKAKVSIEDMNASSSESLDSCAKAKATFQNLIDAANFDSNALTQKANGASGQTIVATKTLWQTDAQSWTDFACDLETNKAAFLNGTYQVSQIGNPPTGSNGCYQSSPYFRAILGGNYSAASSTDPQFKLVADLTVDIPLGTDKKKSGVANSQHSWLWGYARIGSLSKQTSVIDPSQIVSDYASLSGAQPSQIVQSFEMNGGYAYQFLPWKGNLTYFDHGSFSLIAGGGALTPLSPSQVPNQTYTTPQAGTPTTTINYADGTPYINLSGANCGGTPPLCYVTFSPQERSRFYSYWETGLRVKLYAAPQYMKASPFPAIFDVTYGQNEYVTGGHMRGGVIHFGGSAPFSPIPGLYAFGAMDVGINNTADKPISAVLTPFTGTIPTTIQAFQQIQPPLNRDRYSLGFGIDILQLLRTHQIQDAFSAKEKPVTGH